MRNFPAKNPSQRYGKNQKTGYLPHPRRGCRQKDCGKSRGEHRAQKDPDPRRPPCLRARPSDDRSPIPIHPNLTSHGGTVARGFEPSHQNLKFQISNSNFPFGSSRLTPYSVLSVPSCKIQLWIDHLHRRKRREQSSEGSGPSPASVPPCLRARQLRRSGAFLCVLCALLFNHPIRSGILQELAEVAEIEPSNLTSHGGTVARGVRSR